eukprot:TRINITY_DN65328_c0_g1_i1.p1 TRINITY_DN65328_c0_g1~~TRINITY_DN65328_c0_g1_i1.p1  ORF type:complete len:328 (+),score=20.41 TRINITY_DN65328_c0_g1_i1:148-1131(+)
MHLNIIYHNRDTDKDGRERLFFACRSHKPTRTKLSSVLSNPPNTMNASSMLNAFIAFVLVFKCLSSTTLAQPVTAAAVIHEQDGTWGSVVFHQWKRTTPVVISMLFQNLKVSCVRLVGKTCFVTLTSFFPHSQIYGTAPVNYQLWDEPVHYDWYSRAERCSPKALKSLMKVNGSGVGDLGMRHRLMSSDRFAEVVYDKKLSLYEDEPHNIIGKTFVIQQGADESSYSCATIYASKLHSQRPGAIPCEVKQYPDCVVGATEDGKCTLRSCYGYRQYWGLIDDKTLMCAQVREVYPTRVEGSASADGLFPCKYGNHTLLTPIDSKAHLL